MALPLVVDGVTFNYPEPGDRGLAQEATDWADAVTDAVANLQTDVAADFVRCIFRARISTPQTSISAATVVVFDTEDTDVGGGYNPLTGIFTVPSAAYAGDYIFTASTSLTQVSSTGVNRLRILKNGTEVASAMLPSVPTNTASTSLSVSVVLAGLVASDTIKCDLLASAGTITTVETTGSQFSGVRIGHA